MLMETFTLVNGWTTKLTDMAHTHMQTAPSMKEIGAMINKMVKDMKLGPMALFIKETIMTVKSMEMVS